LIREHTEELHLDGGVDHRRVPAERHATWFVGDDHQSFVELFDALNGELHGSTEYHQSTLTIHGHRLQAQRLNGTLAWFSFHELCEKPRSAQSSWKLNQASVPFNRWA